RYDGVTFRVGDVKAMLTEGHYGDKATVFGERYTGDGCDFQDIYPDKLWKVMQDYIGAQKLPLLMDLDPGVQVWTYPVYGYRIEYNRSDDVGCRVTGCGRCPDSFRSPSLHQSFSQV